MGEGHEHRRRIYTNEHHAFRSAAYRIGLCDELWESMDRLLYRMFPI
jgi:hypothetical protein